MFTGIIVELGKVFEIKRLQRGAKLTVESKIVSKEASVGDSISVNGVCLTVSAVDKSKDFFSFDVSHETLEKTTLGYLKKADPVNLEPAITLNTKLGGHLVSGHVEGMGIINLIERTGDYLNIEIQAPEDILKYCIKKGSIAVDGISLTIVEVLSKSFTVVIIPHTAKMTTMGTKKVGDRVNLEPDMIAKYVERFVIKYRDSGDETLIEKLKISGFIRE